MANEGLTEAQVSIIGAWYDASQEARIAEGELDALRDGYRPSICAARKYLERCERIAAARWTEVVQAGLEVSAVSMAAEWSQD